MCLEAAGDIYVFHLYIEAVGDIENCLSRRDREGEANFLATSACTSELFILSAIFDVDFYR